MNAIQRLVDELGDLKADKARLEDRETAIKSILIKKGVTPVEGDYFRCTVSESKRTYIDWKTIAAKLDPSRQLVNAHTTRKPVTTVRCVARKGGAA